MNKDGAVCYISAVFLNWSVLLTQAWLVLIAFEVSSQFRRAIPSRDARSMKRFKIYLILTFLYAAAVVTAAVVSDQKKELVGYGRYLNVCWIQNRMARIATYIAPQFAATVIGFASFSFVVFQVRRRSAQNQAVLSSQGRGANTLLIAAKLAALFGIAEIVSCIQIDHPSSEMELAINAAFALLYTILRCSRGVLLGIFYFKVEKIKCCCASE